MRWMSTVRRLSHGHDSISCLRSTLTLADATELMVVDLDNGSRRHTIIHPRLHDYRQRFIDEDDKDQLVEGGRDAAVDRRSPT